MKDKTRIEAEHYNQKVAIPGDYAGQHVQSRVDRVLRNSHECFIDLIRKFQIDKKSGLMLDYGCGTGSKTMLLANKNWKILGIDVSSVSVEIANKAAQINNANAVYTVMDCEQMDFPDDHFDIVVDYGTFSSLNMQKAQTEILRVLKPDGGLVAIETFGHNPVTNFKRWVNVMTGVTNFKRWVNVMTGKRTKWAAGHIMKHADWKKMAACFSKCEMYYWGFWVLFLAPVITVCPQWIFRSFEAADRLFFKIPFVRRLAFKTVVVLKNPIKRNK